jgi:hypothetical protein
MIITHFYLDSNSIIYDVIHKSKETPTDEYILQHVIHKIMEYIKEISPTKLVYIAFDGVAPIAKLEQQRQRRYKSWYKNKIMSNFHPTEQELLKTLLEPLLGDFQYWFSRATTLLETELIPFFSQEEQTNLLGRVRQAQQEVLSAKMLFEAMDEQVGVDMAMLMVWPSGLKNLKGVQPMPRPTALQPAACWSTPPHRP